MKTDVKTVAYSGVAKRVHAVNRLADREREDLPGSVRPFLRDRSPRVRAAALDVIRDTVLRELTHGVRPLLSDKSPVVRLSAVECLGSLFEGKPAVSSCLYPLLQDPDYLVRIEALESLAQIGNKKVLPLMAKRLRDEHPLVRGYAAICIADFGEERYVAPIRRALKTEKADAALVRFASALFALGDPNQFTVLLSFLSAPDYRVRCAAANAINWFELTAGQTEAALKALSKAIRNALGRADRLTMQRVSKELRNSKRA